MNREWMGMGPQARHQDLSKEKICPDCADEIWAMMIQDIFPGSGDTDTTNPEDGSISVV